MLKNVLLYLLVVTTAMAQPVARGLFATEVNGSVLLNVEPIVPVNSLANGPPLKIVSNANSTPTALFPETAVVNAGLYWFFR